jgi:hypothetical protein
VIIGQFRGCAFTLQQPSQLSRTGTPFVGMSILQLVCRREIKTVWRPPKFAAQRCVVGDYISGKVAPQMRASKRTFKPEDMPGAKTAGIPFKLWYDPS